jgi:hypothetical protein
MMTSTTTPLKARAIAFYLPQYHPIPENDAWWGLGFTEWTNTAKAKPLFAGHYQPHVPADLGFYDLRTPESRQQQASLAAQYGIEGFCYYHYWFGGKRILERPFQEVLTSGHPDFPFCLCWANESWTGIWHNAPKRMLIEQTYPGIDDHRSHFASVLPAFRDPRYISVEGRPIFMIYKPQELVDTRATIALWQQMAADAGLRPIYFIGYETTVPALELIDMGFDAVAKPPVIRQRPWVSRKQPLAWLRQKIRHHRGTQHVYDYAQWASQNRPQTARDYISHPVVVHAWDNTPRIGTRGVVLKNPEPSLFASLLAEAIETSAHHAPGERIIFLKGTSNNPA